MKRHQSIIALFIGMMIVFMPMALAKEELKDFKGNTQSIEQHTGKGKWTIVMLWAHDCHVCNEEAHQYVKFHEKHKNKDARVLGVSLDGKKHFDDAQNFIKRHDVSFPNLIGEPYTVAAIYEELTGATWFGTPTFLIYNPAGELRAQQAGAVPVHLVESFMEKESTNKQTN